MNYFSKFDLQSYGISMVDAKLIPGQNAFRTFCPTCHRQRKREHQKERELYVNLDNGSVCCHNCGMRYRMDTIEYQEYQRNRQVQSANCAPQLPTSVQRQNASTNLKKIVMKTVDAQGNAVAAAKDADHYSEEMADYLLHQRKLSKEVLQQMQVMEMKHWMPKSEKVEDCVVFRFIEKGRVVNEKLRSLDKQFLSTTGAETIPYNLDSCTGAETIIITEGEIDALSFLTAGFTAVISIPNGASGSIAWMQRAGDNHYYDKLLEGKNFLIATDMDEPGVKAAEELAKRLGPANCSWVHFPEGCKDANDVLVKLGVEQLKRCVQEASPFPLPDVVELADFQEQLDELFTKGPQPGALTGWSNLDSKVRFALGQLALVTGRSNDGKSEWLDELVLRLSLRNHWKIGYWSPENTLYDHATKIIEKISGRAFRQQGKGAITDEHYALCKRWMNSHCYWIQIAFDQLRLQHILESALALVRARGIQLLVLDPFNFILKENNAALSENAWDSQVVGTIRQFAVDNNLLVFLVAHPRKVEMQIDGRKRRITMEDISGTADFGNKADYCFCVDRDDEHHVVTIYVDKVRQKRLGSKGTSSTFNYDSLSGRYLPCTVDPQKKILEVDQSQNKMWITSFQLDGEPDILFGSKLPD